MPSNYRRPGVYLEEASLRGPGEIGVATSVALFVGAAAQGDTVEPKRIQSWAEYDSAFGGFTQPSGISKSYLPYAVYSYFQNGGRIAYVMRAVSGSGGVAASVPIVDDTAPTPNTAFNVEAKSVGTWGNDLKVGISFQQSSAGSEVYTLYVFREIGGASVEVERFANLSLLGQIPGTKRADLAINDEVYGSKYIRVADLDTDVVPAEGFTYELTGGVDGGIPASNDLVSATDTALESIDGPVVVNVAGLHLTNGSWVSASPVPPVDRGDVFVINDNHDKRSANQTSTAYATAVQGGGSGLTSISGNSYVASYTPWITVPDPAVNGGTLVIPPGGAVAGVLARTDATSGVFQSPAGVGASITNALNVDAKFKDADLGDLNSNNINVIRPVVGQGICIMGGRTRKTYGVDRYINARRTLIYVKETLRRSTQFALFQSNDEALWSQLAATADRILRPIWNSGGLRGDSSSEAYFIVCDESINTPDVIASGEVRMEVGVALQYPAEFIVIRVSQFESGSSTTEIVA